MHYAFPSDIADLVNQFLASGQYASADDVLREALVALGENELSAEIATEEYRQAVESVREGIDDMENGRMRPLRALLQELRS
jgi:Arc/MetJ-type ribon-helix-helix transcriptional regulator